MNVLLNPVTPNSDQFLISPQMFTTRSSILVKRIKGMITKRFDVETNSHKLYHNKYREGSKENIHVDAGASHNLSRVSLWIGAWLQGTVTAKMFVLFEGTVGLC